MSAHPPGRGGTSREQDRRDGREMSSRSWGRRVAAEATQYVAYVAYAYTIFSGLTGDRWGHMVGGAMEGWEIYGG